MREGGLNMERIHLTDTTWANQDDADFVNKIYKKVIDECEYHEDHQWCHDIYQEMSDEILDKYRNEYGEKGLEHFEHNDILIIHKSNHFRRLKWITDDHKYAVILEPNLVFTPAGGMRNEGLKITCITPDENEKVFITHLANELKWGEISIDFEDICKCEFVHILGLE